MFVPNSTKRQRSRLNTRSVVLYAAVPGFVVLVAWVPFSVLRFNGVPEELRWACYLTCPGFFVPWPGMPKELTRSTLPVAIALAAFANAVIYGGVAFLISSIWTGFSRARRHSDEPSRQWAIPIAVGPISL